MLFIDWLDKMDPNANRLRRELILDAYNRFDFNTVSIFFEDYISERGRLKNSEPQTESQEAPKEKEPINVQAQFYLARGDDYAKRGQYDEAIDNYSTAIVLIPNKNKAYLLRGDVYLKKGKYYKAIEDFNKGIALNPDDDGAYAWRGGVYVMLGLLELAIEDLTRTGLT